MKNLIIFYPSYERGGATKILINLIKYFSKKNINIYLIINNFEHKFKNLKTIKLNSNIRLYKSRLLSSLLGSWELIKLINTLDKSDTKILSMQSNFFAVLIAFFKNIKIAVRVSEDPCGATRYADEKIFSYFILFSKFITYNLANYVIVNAQKSYNCVKKLVYNKKKLKILYNPSLNIIHKFKKKKNNKIFLSVGRFCKQKNQKLLINAFIRFNKNKNYKLIICGDGPDKKDIFSYIKEKKLEKSIILKNWRSDLRKNYKNSSVFILTSLYEGMPNVLIEALNYNLPCVSTNVSGVTDLLLKGKGGIILKNFSPYELENKLNKITNNYKIYLNKTKNAKSNLKRFDINVASNEYLKLLEKI